nr:SCO family protein [Pseudomonas sp.]
MQFISTNHARRRVLRHALAGLLALSFGAGLAACSKDSASFNSTDVTGAEIGKGWHLPDVDGNMRSAEDFKGKIAVVFFGFIQCPDVCPTTLAELAQVKAKLGEESDQLQVLFVTVDPERDTPDIIRQYLSQFNPTFIGLRGNAEQLAETAKTFKAFYAKAPVEPAPNYTMDHSAGLYIFDQTGAVRLYARGGQTPDELAADIRQLMQ